MSLIDRIFGGSESSLPEFETGVKYYNSDYDGVIEVVCKDPFLVKYDYLRGDHKITGCKVYTGPGDLEIYIQGGIIQDEDSKISVPDQTRKIEEGDTDGKRIDLVAVDHGGVVYVAPWGHDNNPALAVVVVPESATTITESDIHNVVPMRADRELYRAKLDRGAIEKLDE